jgi:hypothetical protein
MIKGPPGPPGPPGESVLPSELKVYTDSTSESNATSKERRSIRSDSANDADKTQEGSTINDWRLKNIALIAGSKLKEVIDNMNRMFTQYVQRSGTNEFPAFTCKDLIAQFDDKPSGINQYL